MRGTPATRRHKLPQAFCLGQIQAQIPRDETMQERLGRTRSHAVRWVECLLAENWLLGLFKDFTRQARSLREPQLREHFQPEPPEPTNSIFIWLQCNLN